MKCRELRESFVCFTALNPKTTDFDQYIISNYVQQQKPKNITSKAFPLLVFCTLPFLQEDLEQCVHTITQSHRRHVNKICLTASMLSLQNCGSVQPGFQAELGIMPILF